MKNVILMAAIKHPGVVSSSNRPDWNFYDSIIEKEDIRPFIDCMTCGKCVGDCIAAKNSEFNARKIVQKIIEGHREGLISGDEIWRCFLCDLCTIKCPKKIEIKKLMLILRKLALQAGKGYTFLKYIEGLPRSFLEKGLIVPQIKTSLREKLGLSPEIALSEKTKKELTKIIEKTNQKKDLQEFLKRCAD
jgi:heterodisulfide reductase subunit C